MGVTLSTVCPGLWTIGSEIISDSGFVLNGFIRYIRYNDYYSSWLETVNITEYFFGFEATKGWDPASGLGTLGISGGVALIRCVKYFLVHHLTLTNLNAANQRLFLFLFLLLRSPKRVVRWSSPRRSPKPNIVITITSYGVSITVSLSILQFVEIQIFYYLKKIFLPEITPNNLY